MEVVVTTAAVRRAQLQSKCHHQQTDTQFFLQTGCPSCRPTNSVKAPNEKSGVISGKWKLLTVTYEVRNFLMDITPASVVTCFCVFFGNCTVFDVSVSLIR